MIHPLFADILQKQLGVEMCDDDRHDDVDYDYPEQKSDEYEVDFEAEQAAELRGNRL